MRNRLAQLLGSSVARVADAINLWRHGANLRRAEKLCQCADALRLRCERDHEVRSLRLYRRAAAQLSGVRGAGEPVGSPHVDWAAEAHRIVALARRPYRRGWSAIFVLSAAAVVPMLLVVLVLAWLSPPVRAYLFPRDLAAGRPWTATNADSGYAASGTDPGSDGDLFFHTTSVDSPSVEIDLGAEHVLRRIRVENRSNCCKDRAVPLNVEVRRGTRWELIAQRRASFSTWVYDLPATTAQWVRLRRPGTGFFHLKRVSLFGN